MRQRAVGLLAALLAGVSAAWGQEAATPRPAAPERLLLEQTFARDTEGWTAFGEIARVDRTDDAALVPRPGASALRFEYTVDKRFLGAMTLPLEPGKLAGAGNFAFQVRAAVDSTLAVTLEEKEGGRFIAVFHAPKGLWQNVALSPSEFLLSKGENDPVDANGKLDLDRVQSIGILDLAQLFVRSDNPAIATLFGALAGPRTLLVSGVRVGVAPLAPPGYPLDGLARPQIGWIRLGGVQVKRTGAGPIPGTSLEAAYRVGPGAVAGLVRPLPIGMLTGKESLAFTAAVEKSATLMIQLEDDRGGKFSQTVSIAGVRAPKRVTLPFTDFKPTDDSKVDRFEAARVKQILVLDLSGLLESADQSNTLWLAGFEPR